jgi:hypothetical protein
MTSQDLIFYSSENGDAWLLVGGGSDGVTVRHRPNAASGGKMRDIGLREFLTSEQNTPQNQALCRLIEAEVPAEPSVDQAALLRTLRQQLRPSTETK